MARYFLHFTLLKKSVTNLYCLHFYKFIVYGSIKYIYLLLFYLNHEILNLEDIFDKKSSYFFILLFVNNFFVLDHNPKLFLYGSASNDFALRRHDVDVCLTIDTSVGTKGEIIQVLADSLSNGNL